MNEHNYLLDLESDHRVLHSLNQIYTYLCLQSMNWVHLKYHAVYICNVIFTNFINNIFFIDSVRPKNTICLLPSSFSISLKLLKFAGKIIYYCLPNLISNEIYKSWVELMGPFILSDKWITVLPFLDICTNLTWNPWFSCIFRRYGLCSNRTT